MHPRKKQYRILDAVDFLFFERWLVMSSHVGPLRLKSGIEGWTTTDNNNWTTGEAMLLMR
jgi:hypothetical protein